MGGGWKQGGNGVGTGGEQSEDGKAGEGGRGGRREVREACTGDRIVGLPADAVRSPPLELNFISGVFFTNINRFKCRTTCGTWFAYAFTLEADISGRTRLCAPFPKLAWQPGKAIGACCAANALKIPWERSPDSAACCCSAEKG